MKRNAFFQLIQKDDGMYLKAYPEVDGGEKLSVEDVLNYLDKKNLKDVDSGIVKYFVEDANSGKKDVLVKVLEGKQIPEKEFQLMHGGCPTHVRITVKDVEKARAAHPDAELLVHPECQPAVTAQADYVGSTTGIMNYAAKSDKKSFIIGTENSIVQHLGMQFPDKLFYPLSKDCVCHNMKVTTLADVLHCLQGVDGEEIQMPEDVMQKAKVCIEEMLRLGN